MIKLALFGYGQMGKLIHQLVSDYETEVISIYDQPLGYELNQEKLNQSEVIIDFSLPDQVITNLKLAAENKKNIVVGTTGWYDQLPAAMNICQQADLGMIYGSNFSLGMNLFLEMINSAAKMMDKSPEYDIYGYEMHHNKKIDSPSGTAKVISDKLLKNITRKKKVIYNSLNRKIQPEEFHFSSLRAGSIPGIHAVGFDSQADTIELTHTARNRSGFAIGAIKAANWIRGKRGIYNFSEIFKELI